MWLARTFGLELRWALPTTVLAADVVAGVRPCCGLRREPDLQAKAGSHPAIYRSQEIQVVMSG